MFKIINEKVMKRMFLILSVCCIDALVFVTNLDLTKSKKGNRLPKTISFK